MISQSNIFIVLGRQDRTSHHVIKVLVDTLSTWSKAYVVGPVVHIGTVEICLHNMYIFHKKSTRMFSYAKIIFRGFSSTRHFLLAIFPHTYIHTNFEVKPMHSKIWLKFISIGSFWGQNLSQLILKLYRRACGVIKSSYKSELAALAALSS